MLNLSGSSKICRVKVHSFSISNYMLILSFRSCILLFSWHFQLHFSQILCNVIDSLLFPFTIIPSMLFELGSRLSLRSKTTLSLWPKLKIKTPVSLFKSGKTLSSKSALQPLLWPKGWCFSSMLPPSIFYLQTNLSSQKVSLWLHWSLLYNCWLKISPAYSMFDSVALVADMPSVKGRSSISSIINHWHNWLIHSFTSHSLVCLHFSNPK